MEIIRFKGSDDIYLAEVYLVNSNVMGLVFQNEIPENYLNGFEQINVSNGVVEGNYLDFTTEYRTYEDEPLKIELSNDESVYVPPALVEPEPPEPEEPYVPTLEEVKSKKHSEMSTTCQAIIFNGFDVELSSGELKHFSLTYEDQINLIGKQMQVAQGEENIEYHPSSIPTSPCIYYSNADMLKIIETAFAFKSYHSTYCNSLYVWIDACETKEEVDEIFYGASVPVEYQSVVLQDYMKAMTPPTDTEIPEETEDIEDNEDAEDIEGTEDIENPENQEETESGETKDDTDVTEPVDDSNISESAENTETSSSDEEPVTDNDESSILNKEK